MALMKVCPSCRSTKVRNGYLKPPLLLRLLFIRDFLCESCNLEFRAFALRPAKSRGVRMRRKANRFNEAPAVDLSMLKETQPSVRLPAKSRLDFEQPVMAPPAEMEHALRRELQARQPESAAAYSPAKKHLSSHSSRPCPQCGSRDARRRHRRVWERVIFSLTEIRAYTCQSCGASFYARREKSKATSGQPFAGSSRFNQKREG
jgi:transposase-like protein